MARTPKPLVIWAEKHLEDNETLRMMALQGHQIQFIDMTPDLIIGQSCWRIVEGLETYIPLAVEVARKRRYPRSKPDPTL